MKLQIRALMGIAIISLSSAQDHAFNTTAGSTDPLVAAQEAQKQAQFQFENQLADLQTSANQSKSSLLSRRTQLNRELQKCFTDKNTAGIDAERQAGQAEQQATQQLVQSAPQSLTPLLQSFSNTNELGKEEAKSQRESAVALQNQQVDRFVKACNGPTQSMEAFSLGMKLKADPKLNKQVISNISSAISTASANPDPNCQNAQNSILAVTTNSKREIEQAKAADGAFTGNLLNAGMAAAAIGVNIYGYQNAKDAAKQGLADANRLNALNYDSCKTGVEDEAKEIDKQLASIDRQLASDKDRLAKQFAQFKINLPPNIQNKTLLDVEGGDTSGDAPTLISVGSAVSPTTFKGITNSFDGLKKPGEGGGAAGGGGGGAGGGGGGEGDGKAAWGFRDPYETNNPGMSYTLPQQPDKAGLIAGSGEGTDGAIGGGGGEFNPFGPGFQGFDDAFANVNGKGAALAASEGNGFWELAMKTRRRIYAHLGELLGHPSGTKISKEKEKTPERKISSVRE